MNQIIYFLVIFVAFRFEALWSRISMLNLVDAQPTTQPTSSVQSCAPFTYGYQDSIIFVCQIYTCTAGKVILSACPEDGGTFTGFLYYEFRNVDSSTLQTSTGACSNQAGAKIEYTKTDSTCQLYYLYQQCYKSSTFSCSSRTVVSGAVPTNSKTIYSTPSTIPTLAPTLYGSTNAPTAATVCISGDQDCALKKLFEATGGNGNGAWLYKTNWNYWDVSLGIVPFGIKLNRTTLKYIELDLSSNRLIGNIPTEIGWLTDLQKLILNDNNITGTIPSQIASLSNLQKLSLARNSLEGYIPDLSPASQLSWISLQGNLFTGAFPESLAVLTTDGFGYFSDNKFSGPLPVKFTYSSLSLFNNVFTGIIPGDFCNYDGLHLLLLSGNVFDCFVPCVPLSGTYDYLVDVSSGYDVCVANNTQYEALCAIDRSLGISSSLPEWETVTVTEKMYQRSISATSIVDTYFYYDPNYISVYIEFDQSIRLGGIHWIDRNVPYYYNITISISDDGIQFNSTNLVGTFESLYAFSSWSPYLLIDIEIINILPQVSKSYNAQSRVAIPSYSFSVTTTSHAVRWQCNNATVNKTVGVTNPCSWRGLSCLDNANVDSISLGHLSLTGKIPDALSDLRFLTLLDLSYNSISGSIPETIGLMTWLRFIDLRSNNLNGTLPASFKHNAQSSLMQLVYIDYNHISDTLEAYLLELKFLITFSANYNDFYGSIPAEFCESQDQTNYSFVGNKISCATRCAGITQDGDMPSQVQFDGQYCDPTQQPTPMPTLVVPPVSSASTLSYSSVVGISAASVIAAVLLCYLLYVQWSYRNKLAEFKGLPVHKVIATGDVKAMAITDCLLKNLNTIHSKDSHGRTAAMLLIERLDWFQSAERKALAVEWLYVIVTNSLHFDPVTGAQKDVAEHNYAWPLLIQSGNDVALDVVNRILDKFDVHIDLLSDGTDSMGRKCIDIASPMCKKALRKCAMLFGCFELKPGPPEHKSATSLVKFAVKQLDEPRDRGADDSFPVALKFMKFRSQFLTELNARSGFEFSKEFVIPVLESFDGDSDEHNNVAFRASALKRGYADYPYCVVMEIADTSLQRVIFQQHVASHDWDMIKLIVKSLCLCLDHIFKAGVLHGDIKPMNVVMVNNSVRLIDFDASSRMGEFAGAKYSSAYLPPEMFFEKSPGNFVVRTFIKDANGEPTSVIRRSDGECVHASGYKLLRSSPAQDMWAVGAILYLLCTGVHLFQSSIDDNLGASEMELIYNWTDNVKEQRLSVVQDKYARNLLSLLLNKDPSKRPSPSHVVAHPFISGLQPKRLQGESAKYDVFLSYRVDSDSEHVALVYKELLKLELSVWWDKVCLLPGQPWEEGFCDGLVNSACFVCLMSRNAINHTEKPWQNFAKLEASSRCDNVLLEWRLALELRDREMIQGVYPVFIGDLIVSGSKMDYSDYFGSGCHPKLLPDVAIDAVEAKLREHLNRQGLGLPLESKRTVKHIVDTITSNQGGFLRGNPVKAMDEICNNICEMARIIREGSDSLGKLAKANEVEIISEFIEDDEFTVEVRNEYLVAENKKLHDKLREFEAILKQQKVRVLQVSQLPQAAAKHSISTSVNIHSGRMSNEGGSPAFMKQTFSSYLLGGLSMSTPSKPIYPESDNQLNDLETPH